MLLSRHPNLESALRSFALSLCLLTAGLMQPLPAAADDAVGAALDKLAATFPGTWKSDGESFKTEYGAGGKSAFTTVRDCWRTPDAFKCVLIQDGGLRAETVFTYNAATGLYYEDEITPKGRAPSFTLMVKDNVWTYHQDTTDAAGNAIVYEIVRTFTSPTTVEYHSEYTRNGKEWIGMTKGTETKVDTGK